MNPIVILDAGHGVETAGKRSPVWADGSQLFEYEFNRDIVDRIARELSECRISHNVLVPELRDASLSERCKRANDIWKKSGKNAFLISVHANAGGGTGWECYTSVGDTKADAIASILCQQAKSHLPAWRMRFDHSDADPDKESQFYILHKTQCPAVLTENLFMDRKRDCKYIMSEEGRATIAQLHIEAIKKIISETI